MPFIRHVLKQNTRESYANWKQRVDEGCNFNYTTSIVDLFNFYLTEKPATRVLSGLEEDPLWKAFFKDCDHNGTNFDQIAPGVYRSNQPSHRRLARYRAMGIRTILYLRASSEKWAFHFERESLDALGMTMVSVPLHSRSAPTRDAVQALIAADQKEKLEALTQNEGSFGLPV
jgi:hypothetical protein